MTSVLTPGSEPKRDPRPGEGRPTKYDPAYCEAVIEHMEGGASLTSFAASISVARSSINEWMGAHPEFSEAVNVAKAKCAAWWEERGRQIAQGGGNSAAATLAVFGMKNMGADDWKEASQIDHRSGDRSMSPPTLADFYADMRAVPGQD